MARTAKFLTPSPISDGEKLPKLPNLPMAVVWGSKDARYLNKLRGGLVQRSRTEGSCGRWPRKGLAWALSQRNNAQLSTNMHIAIEKGEQLVSAHSLGLFME